MRYLQNTGDNTQEAGTNTTAVDHTPIIVGGATQTGKLLPSAPQNTED